MPAATRALALETSGRVGSIALAEGGVVVAEDGFGHGLQHAATLLPRIDAATRRLGWAAGSIGEIYVSIGPGSFTGLRVGVTLAKAVAFATGARLVAVPTARVLLANAPAGATDVVVVLDAKRGQIYTARFTRDPAPPAPAPPSAWTEAEPAHLDTLAAVLARSAADRPGRVVHLIGEGLPYHAAPAAAAAGRVVVTPEAAWQARAAAVLALGHAAAARGEYVEPDALTPLYVRLPEAEEKRLDAERAARLAAAAGPGAPHGHPAPAATDGRPSR